MSELFYMEPNIPMVVPNAVYFSYLTFIYAFIVFYLIGSFNVPFIINKFLDKVNFDNEKKIFCILYFVFSFLFTLLLFDISDEILLLLDDIKFSNNLFMLNKTYRVSYSDTHMLYSILEFLKIFGFVLGNIYPLYFKFKGNKGIIPFLVYLLYSGFGFIPLYFIFVLFILFREKVFYAFIFLLSIIIILVSFMSLISFSIYSFSLIIIPLIILYKYKDVIMKIKLGNGNDIKFSELF